MITRIYPDIAAADVNRVVNQLSLDGDCTTAEQTDGNFTVTLQMPGDPPPAEPPAAGSIAEKWMTIARGEIGVKETPDNNPRITQYFENTNLGPQPETVPWCSAFVNFCMAQANIAGSGSAMARSWLGWGRDPGEFVPGCVVVISRGTPPTGHVGFFVGMDGDHIRLLGGNQHDAVNCASFPKASVVGKRMPEETQG